MNEFLFLQGGKTKNELAIEFKVTFLGIAM
jgi:hypothetical protein